MSKKSRTRTKIRTRHYQRDTPIGIPPSDTIKHKLYFNLIEDFEWRENRHMSLYMLKNII